MWVGGQKTVKPVLCDLWTAPKRAIITHSWLVAVPYEFMLKGIFPTSFMQQMLGKNNNIWSTTFAVIFSE